MSSPENAPLSGIKVLDLTRIVSGPFATMLLGDLGADVVKIEEPSRGDESRSYGPPFPGGESAYFLSINRNKRSCAIDLKTQSGRDLVRRMATLADVVIENFRPGTLDRLGLGFDELLRLNDRLVCCSISGFGREGPDATRPGYDLIVQGEAGLMDVTGDPDGPPTKLGVPIADLVSALYAAQAILAGLLRRDRTGRGGRVDIAMLDAVASLLTFNSGIFFATGVSPTRRANAHPTICPYETFQASDGWINVGVANDKFWSLFCEALGLPVLCTDARFTTNAKRVAQRPALKAILDPVFAQQPRHHWVDLLTVAGVPCGEIKTIAEVCSAPRSMERGLIVSAEHPAAGTWHSITSALRFEEASPPPVSRPPMLGEHTVPVLSDWLGLREADVEALAREGALGLLKEVA